jgi:hypothetical protein
MYNNYVVPVFEEKVCQRFFYCITEPERGVLPAVMQSFGLHFLAGTTRASLSGF